MPRPIGQKLLTYDRKLGARFVAGADEAGRGPLAGPLVVAGVLLDLECLRHNRARPLSLLNDSKQLDRDTLQDTLNGPLALLEEIFASAASGGEFNVDTDVWNGLQQLVGYVRKDMEQIIEQDVAFDQQEEARTAGAKSGIAR